MSTNLLALLWPVKGAFKLIWPINWPKKGINPGETDAHSHKPNPAITYPDFLIFSHGKLFLSE